MVFQNITLMPVFGLPLIAYGGIITGICLLTTATLGYLTHIGKDTFSYHRFFAFTTIILGLIHGTLAILAFIK